MNRTAGPLILLAFLQTSAEIPRVAFSGAYGGTLGGGSVLAWDRLGADQSAAMGAPGWSASVAGYAPFGIEDIGVLEIAGARDAPRWGASLAARTVSEARAVTHARVTGQVSRRMPGGMSAGVSLSARVIRGDPGVESGMGLLWRPHPAITVGAFGEDASGGPRAALGADVGTRAAGDAAWRFSAEAWFGAHARPEARLAFAFRFHPLLGAYAGYAPGLRSASLGVRFGFGDWEGFSALRRHAILGGTPVQGIRWLRKEP